MKKRIIVAVIGVPLLLAMLLFAPPLVLAIFIALLSIIGTREILTQYSNVLGIISKIASELTAAALPIWIYWGSPETAAFIWLFGYMIVISCDTMFICKKNTDFSAMAAAAIASLFVPYFLSSLLNLRLFEHGKYCVMLPFVAAFISDAGAYFTGRACGKHKLAPTISPNKTVEGAIGGIVSAIIGVVIYGIIIKYTADVEINYLLIALLGLLGSIAGQIGDLTFSYIKRKFGIKDYGNLLPGHGGVLDRFDSMIFTAPLTEIMLLCFPILV